MKFRISRWQKRADAIVIAPATADLIAKMASGLADDLLTNMVLATTAPIIVVPAMHTEMWLNPATVANVEILKTRGYIVVEPDVGRLTGPEIGVGRYPEVSKILDVVNATLEKNADLYGKKVLISAGGTRESIDPVRYIGNHSSGKQGYALAYAAALRGAKVVLVSANSQIPDIEGVTTIHVSSALQMQVALENEFSDADIVLLAAAVADVRPETISGSKIGKENFSSIPLVRNPDIAATLASKKVHQVMVGFAAQTDDEKDGMAKAQIKLSEKHLDFIYFNDVSNGAIFGSDLTEGIVLAKSGETFLFPQESKLTLANKLLDFALDM
ncbi:MAG: bifunctional phosphopantothenoylcysteine decarboxylase/phosphopantothenate--cysteine ligase CoaBC [Actinomycetota bacterium]